MAARNTIESTPLPTEPGWYWFKGRVHVGRDAERDAIIPIEVKQNSRIALFNGYFSFDYAPFVGEFRRAVIPFE
jgi:hypothetical protein